MLDYIKGSRVFVKTEREKASDFCHELESLAAKADIRWIWDEVRELIEATCEEFDLCQNCLEAPDVYWDEDCQCARQSCSQGCPRHGKRVREY
jgi:hypothetical protein